MPATMPKWSIFCTLMSSTEFVILQKYTSSTLEPAEYGLSGVFDRFPDLQVIIGHWGEVVLFYLERIEHLVAAAKLERPLSEYVRSNVFVTPSGMLSPRYLRWAIEILGAERILFSTDYPFEPASQGGARRFLEAADLSDADREKIASANWERLCAGIRR